MLIKDKNVYDAGEHADQMAMSRDSHFQKCVIKGRENRRQALANRRFKQGKSSTSMVAGRWTTKKIYLPNGTVIEKTRVDGGVQVVHVKGGKEIHRELQRA